MFVEQVQQQFEHTHTWDMETLEFGLREALLKDGCRILEMLLNQPNALGRHTPQGTCHQKRSKRVQGLLGDFQLTRGYYKSKQVRNFPMDDALGLIDSYTPSLAKVMCRAAGTDGSYDEAQETLSVYAGVKVPASQIRRMVQCIGPQIAQWSAHREPSTREHIHTLYATYDGTGVPMRKSETLGRKGKQPDGSAATREVKLGSIFISRGSDREGNPIRDAQSTSYVASFESAAAFGSQIREEAQLRGMGWAERIAVLGDGAKWIWNLARVNFPQARQILDFYHACEHLSKLAGVLCADDQHKSEKLTGKWIEMLENDKVGSVIEQARALLPRHGPRRKAAITEIGYFETNARRMMYASFKKEGYFIGSGVVEAGCKALVGKRTKQSGMFWRVTGAQNILDIRCSIMSNTYEQYWRERKQDHTRRLAA